MSTQLTIMFVPTEGVGPGNACLGLAQTLRDRGHKIVFVIENSYKGKLLSYGFIEEIINDKKHEKSKNQDEKSAKYMIESGLLSELSTLDKVKIIAKYNIFIGLVYKMIDRETELKSIIDRVMPDIYIVDNFIISPSILYSNKPWVYLFSANPLFILDDERTPPGCSGYPSNGDQKQWKEFRQISKAIFEGPKIEYNKWLSSNGYPELETNRCIPDSPYLNIYEFPEQLDYTDIRPLPDNWLRIDAFIRKEEPELKLQDYFLKDFENSVKIIYVSLGSMGSMDLLLMKRLVKVLAESPHKFIISKGIFHNKYELADNMCDEKTIPQINVLNFVDLVITNGGNNSVTEVFSFGKPMIAMPLFGDQYDNAQRIHEKGFGIRLDAYKYKDEELLNSIELLLNDNELKVRLTEASNRMINSESMTNATQHIENLINK